MSCLIIDIEKKSKGLNQMTQQYQVQMTKAGLTTDKPYYWIFDKANMKAVKDIVGTFYADTEAEGWHDIKTPSSFMSFDKTMLDGMLAKVLPKSVVYKQVGLV